MNIKQRNKQWRKSLKNRTEKEFITNWKSLNININYEIIKNVAIIMSLPNHYLYPDDYLSDILFNPYSDFSDVEAILYIEERLQISNINYAIDTKLTLKELFAPNIHV